MKTIVVAGAVLASVLVPVSPAHADVGPVRYDATSPYNGDPSKQAEATCPDGRAVYGAGGQINDGGGDVILTGMVPAADLRSVRVTGLALAGHTGPWSVTAYAICAGPSYYQPYRIQQIGMPFTATATCDRPGTILYGTGFELQPTGNLYLDQLEPDWYLSQVTVHAHGSPQVSTVVAYGVCAYPIDQEMRCVGTSTVTESVLTWCPPFMGAGRIFGVGGLVDPGSDLHLDALVPGPDLQHAIAHAARLPGSAEARLLAGDDESVTAFGDYIGSWYLL